MATNRSKSVKVSVLTGTKPDHNKEKGTEAKPSCQVNVWKFCKENKDCKKKVKN